MRFIRLSISLIVLLAPLVWLSFGTWHLVNAIVSTLRSTPVVTHIASVEASRALNRTVTIGKVQLPVSPLSKFATNQIVLSDVKVADDEHSHGGTLASARTVRIVYVLDEILNGSTVVPFMRSIDIVSPVITIREDASGKWNVTDLVRPGAASARPAVGAVRVAGGEITVSLPDHANRSAFKLLHFGLRQLNGQAVIDADKSFQVSLTGAPTDRIASTLALSGVFSGPDRHAIAHLSLQHADLSQVSNYVKLPGHNRVERGDADLTLDATYTPEDRKAKLFDAKALQVRGTAHVQRFDANLDLLDAPLRDGDVTLNITDSTVQASVLTRIGAAPLTAEISVTRLPGLTKLIDGSYPLARLFDTSGSPPEIQVQLDTPVCDLNALYRALRIETVIPKLPPNITHSIRTTTAVGDVHVRLSGVAGNPAGSAWGHLENAAYDNVHGTDISLTAELSNRVLSASAHGKYADGLADLRIKVGLDKEAKFQMLGRGRKLSLAAIGFKLGPLHSAYGDLDMAMTARRGRSPAITAHVQATDVAVNRHVFQHVYASAESAGRKLRFNTLRVDDSKGFALASGDVDLITKAVSGNVEADGIDLHALVDAVWPEPPLAIDPTVPSLFALEGSGYLRKGVIGGKYDDPVLSGELSCFGVSTGNYIADRAVASFRLSSSGIVVGRGSIERYPTLIEFAGSVVDFTDEKPAFDFNIHATDLDLNYLAQLASVDPAVYAINGTLSTDDSAGIRVFGKPGSIRVESPGGAEKGIPFSLRRTSVNGLKIPVAYGSAYYDEAGLRLENAHIEAGGGVLSGSGVIGPSGSLALKVDGAHIGIGAISPVIANATLPDADGQISFKAEVTGTYQHPTGNLTQLEAADVRVRNIPIGAITATGNYHDSAIELQNVQLVDSRTHTVTIAAPHASIDIKSKKISSPLLSSPDAIKIVDLPVTRIDELARAFTTALDSNAMLSETKGGLTAKVALSGTFEDPEAEVLLNSTGIEFRGYRVVKLTGETVVSQHEVRGSNVALTVQPMGQPTSNAEQRPADTEETSVNVHSFNVEFGGKVYADVDVNNLNVGLIQSSLFPSGSPAFSGRCDQLGILVGGTIKAPRVDFSVNLSGVSYMDRLIDRVDIDHGYAEEGKLQVDAMRVTRSGGKSTTYRAEAAGAINGFTWTAPYLPETATVDFTASVPAGAKRGEAVDLKLLFDFGISAFKDCVGGFNGFVHVVGALKQPRFESGTLSITADRLRLPGFQTGIEALRAKFDIKDDVITVAKDGFEAHTQVFDRKGQPVARQASDVLQLTGSLPVGLGDVTPPQVKDPLTLTAANIPFEERPLPGARTGGISGAAAVKLSVTRSLLHPVISGSITVNSGLASLPSDFTPPTTSSSSPIFNPRFDITLNLSGKNVRMKNPELDARVGGFVSLKGDLANPIVHGRISLNQGYLMVPPRRFDILPPASIELDYGNSLTADNGLSVRINIKARTKLTALSLSGVRKQYTVTVTADGPITDIASEPDPAHPRMHLDFTTDPNDLAISQQNLNERLVTSLFGVGTFNSIGQNPAQSAAGVFTNIFTGYVLPNQFDKISSFIGLDQLELNYDPVQQLAFTVARQLFGPVYVTYNRGLSGENRYYDFKVSLRFRDRYQLSYDLNDQQTQQFLLEGVWRY